MSALVVLALAVVTVVVATRSSTPNRPDSVGSGAVSSSSPSVPLTSAPASTSSVALQVPVPPAATPAAPGVPVRVALPRLGVSSPLEPLGLEADGSLAPPSEYDRAGWYADGARPGAVGPAVIAGHVDSRTGPAIFFRLDELRRGDDVDVTDSTGTVRHFVVDDIQRYVKTAFPTTAVYGPTPLPVLRLITCTGAFDRAKRSYVDNLVVSATLRQPRAG